MARDYKAEYANYQGRPEQIANRSERNKARRIEAAAGNVRKGDGKDVDHKQALSKGGSTTPGNLRVVSASANRSFPRNARGGMIRNS